MKAWGLLAGLLLAAGAVTSAVAGGEEPSLEGIIQPDLSGRYVRLADLAYPGEEKPRHPRGVLVVLHVFIGLCALASAFVGSWPWTVRIPMLLLAGIFAAGGVLLWRGGRVVSLLLVGADLALAAFGAVALVLANTSPLAFAGPLAVAVIGLAMLAPPIRQLLHQAPDPNV